MNVLVTGAGGYLGNVLVPYLSSLGYIITPLDLGIFNVGGVTYYKENLYTDDIRPYLKDADVVVHLAGVSNDPSSELNPLLTEQYNVQASLKLIDLAVEAEVSNFIFISSASVYGVSDGPSREDSFLNPQSIYAASKIQVEGYLKEFNHGMNYTILRLGTLFGPSPKMRYDIAINLMVKTALESNSIDVYGGHQSRPFLHVFDAARAIRYNLFRDRPIVSNVLAENIKIADLAKKVADKTGARIRTHYSSFDTRDYILDNTVMKDYLDFFTIYSIDEGISQLVKFIPRIEDKEDFYTVKAWKRYINDNSLF